MVNGLARTGRARRPAITRSSRWTQLRSACALRRRISAMPASSAVTSGTTRLAASVGVAARMSATRSRSGLSGSCPIALMTGVVHAATARSRASSEKGSRSSTLPPPRAITMTSISGSASRSARCARMRGTAVGPWTGASRTAKRTCVHRACATDITSRCAALARPEISPTVRGRNGSDRLRRGSKSPSAARSCLRRSMRRSSWPTPMGRMSVTRNEIVPRPA
ncbi:Uncharacterised protein [Mycobacteroides abscessus subsp. abscessus]|nr:Uncharacterised protein [Mycobacteroides abscessus subsp. abscessus]